MDEEKLEIAVEAWCDLTRPPASPPYRERLPNHKKVWRNEFLRRMGDTNIQRQLDEQERMWVEFFKVGGYAGYADTALRAFNERYRQHLIKD